jgi:arsenate reductase
MRVKIYHNPRCSKSRQTLQLLQQQAVEPEVVEYLKTPPDKNTLKKILDHLQMAPRDLMRHKEDEYKENHLDDPSLSEDELIEAMIKYPKLIERPIVVTDKGIAIGRPPESVLEVL